MNLLFKLLRSLQFIFMSKNQSPLFFLLLLHSFSLYSAFAYLFSCLIRYIHTHTRTHMRAQHNTQQHFHRFLTLENRNSTRTCVKSIHSQHTLAGAFSKQLIDRNERKMSENIGKCDIQITSTKLSLAKTQFAELFWFGCFFKAE